MIVFTGVIIDLCDYSDAVNLYTSSPEIKEIFSFLNIGEILP